MQVKVMQTFLYMTAETEKIRHLKKRTNSTDWGKLEAGGSFGFGETEASPFKLSEMRVNVTVPPIYNISASAQAPSDDPSLGKQNSLALHSAIASLREFPQHIANRSTLLLFLATGTAVTLTAQAVSNLVGYYLIKSPFSPDNTMSKCSHTDCYGQKNSSQDLQV